MRPARQPDAPMAASAPLRVAIIGLGEAGSGLHLPALARMPTAHVVGGCDRDGKARDRVAARWRIPVFADPDTMLAETLADVVIVATPPASHAEQCLRALACGAHVVCEKPFVSSLDEADRVLAVAKAAGRLVVVNHEFREMPIFRALLDQVREGNAGELQFAQVWQLFDMPPWSESGWRGQIAERTLFEAGVHLVDLLMALYDEQPVAVQAATSSGSRVQPGADAVVVATLEFSGGRLAQLVQNRLCKGERQYFEVRADTDRASFRASFGGRARLSAGLFRSSRPHVRFERGASGLAWREIGTRRVQLARNPADPNVWGTREVLKRAFEAFQGACAPRVDAACARDVLEVIAACYCAARTGSRVRLNDPGIGLRSVRMGAVRV